jgi:hypothetical protein
MIIDVSRLSASERRAYLHTLRTRKTHTEKRIVSLGRQIHELNDEREEAMQRLDDINRSIDWLEE